LKPLLIIKTGKTVTSIPREKGDFEQWITAALQFTQDKVSVCNVLNGDQLPAHDEIAGVVITGSAAMVTERLPWSEYTAGWLRELEDSTTPVLGICYGHQLLAHALGGQVDFHPKGREIGTTCVTLTDTGGSDPLCQGLERNFAAHVSHMQSVTKLPEGASILASNSFEPHQAVRYRSNIWGVQFHPEFSEEVMLAYLKERAPSLQQEGFDVDALLHGVAPTPGAVQLLRNFADQVRVGLA
jgi:GMP synthase (glutamine-hydrolysing)